MITRKLLQRTFCVTLIALSLGGYSRIDAQPRSGDWTASTDFGEFTFRVDSNRTHINKISFTFVSFTCGNITQSGTNTSGRSPGWPITNNEFNIECNYEWTIMTVGGTFTQTGDEASGTWSDNVEGTTCSGTWSTMINSVEEASGRIPERFALAQNYPNPFNPSTTIEFSLPKSVLVNLKVYNILGKEIATLVNNKLQAGNHVVEFHAQNLSSGIYYYRIEAGEFQDVKKMILLR